MPICATCGTRITPTARRLCRACRRSHLRAEYARRKAERARSPEWKELWERIAAEEDPSR